MALKFIIHDIPNEMIVKPKHNEEKRKQISIRLGKINKKLQARMKAIDRKEKRSWQDSLVRN